MTLRATYTPGQTNVDFFAYNAAGQLWNGSAYENFNAANLVTYRIAASEPIADSGKYEGAEPADCVEFELRLRAATLADSQIVAGPAETDTAENTLRSNAAQILNIQRAASPVVAGAAVRKRKVAASAGVLDESTEAI